MQLFPPYCFLSKFLAWVFLLLPLGICAQDYQKSVFQAGSYDFVQGTALDPQSQTIYTVAQSQMQGIFLIRSNTQGQILWTKHFPTSAAYNFDIHDVAVVDGAVFLTGVNWGDSLSSFLAKIDSTGSVQWIHQPSTSLGTVYFHRVVGDGHGNLYVAGWQDRVDGAVHMVIARLRASDGSSTWYKTMAVNHSSSPLSIAANPAGELLLLGQMTDTAGVDSGRLLMKMVTFGFPVWPSKISTRFSPNLVGADANWFYALGEDSTGAMGLLRLNTSGAVDRYVLLNAPSLILSPKDLHVDADGLVIGCVSYVLGRNQGLILRLDTNLNLVYALENRYCEVSTLAGVDAGGKLHFAGRWTEYPWNDSYVVIGAFDEATTSTLPCGMDSTGIQQTTAPLTMTLRAQTMVDLQWAGTVNLSLNSINFQTLSDCETWTDATDPAPSAMPTASPNPVRGTLHLELPVGTIGRGPSWLQLFAMDGREVLRQPAHLGTNDLDLGALPAGVYSLRLGNRWSHKIVVQH